MPRILVVDDELMVRELLTRVLDGDGHDTITAANGREALAIMETTRPDLILLDLMMPVMDGTSFLRVVRRREQWKDLPVIMLSGVVAKQDVLRVRELGIGDYVLKTDFTMEDLRARIQRQLARGQAASLV